MQTLPIFQTDNKQLSLMQTAWKLILTPFLRNPVLQGITLSGITLQNGSNTINHLLGRQLQGWIITRQNGAASVYDSGATDLTLTLVSNATITINLYVF